MLFHVSMTIHLPYDLAPQRVKELTELEHQRANELEQKKKWIHAWRVVGKWANVSIFDVESPSELHEILNSLPLFPFMDIAITALCPMHPTIRE
jgi:muconolactone D-isomerase